MREKRCLASGKKNSSSFSDIINENLPRLKSQAEIYQEREDMVIKGAEKISEMIRNKIIEKARNHTSDSPFTYRAYLEYTIRGQNCMLIDSVTEESTTWAGRITYRTEYNINCFGKLFLSTLKKCLKLDDIFISNWLILEANMDSEYHSSFSLDCGQFSIMDLDNRNLRLCILRGPYLWEGPLWYVDTYKHTRFEYLNQEIHCWRCYPCLQIDYTHAK